MYEHQVLYYGSLSLDDVTENLNRIHSRPEKLIPVPAPIEFKNPEPNTNVYVVDYDMKQAEIIMLAKDGQYDQTIRPQVRMFNEYFGGGMSSVVFQEMRESKALAYSVYSSYSTPQNKTDNNFVFSYLGTQADKLPEAIKGMKDLINNMPESQNNFDACKESILQGIRSERITKSSILFNYVNAQRLGHDHDIRSDIFKQVPLMTLEDVKTFEKNHVKNKTYTTLVLGKKDGLDMKILQSYGKIQSLSLEEIFGY
jgi:predicted Zn-dependent peptidase